MFKFYTLADQNCRYQVTFPTTIHTADCVQSVFDDSYIKLRIGKSGSNDVCINEPEPEVEFVNVTINGTVELVEAEPEPEITISEVFSALDDEGETFIDYERPLEEQVEEFKEDFTKSVDILDSIFLNLKYPDVATTQCFKSIQTFEANSLFDFSCSNEVDPWAGVNTEINRQRILDYYNQATLGCVTVTEEELGGPYSIEAFCDANGARIKRYENSTNCTAGTEEEYVIPWNYCYKGNLKL